MADPLRDTLEIRFGREELSHLNRSLTNLTHWLRGYLSATAEDENGPPGVGVLIDLVDVFDIALRQHRHDRPNPPASADELWRNSFPSETDKPSPKETSP